MSQCSTELGTTAVPDAAPVAVQPIRLAVLNSHPIQYFAPLYAYLQSTGAFEVTALYMSDASLRGARDKGFDQQVTWDVDLLAGYRSVFLGPGAKTRLPRGFFSMVAPEVWSAVRGGSYEALVVHGHQYAANLVAIAAAKSAGIPVLIRGETHLGLVRSQSKRLLRQPLMRLFYSLVDGALAIGSANADYYRAMGVPERKIFLAPYSVDNDRFTSEAKLEPGERARWRARFGIPAKAPAILYAAKFTARKHPDDLLKAALRLRERTKTKFSIVLCGSGELESELRQFCAANDLTEVVFTGFINQAELPKLYASCDVFVLPSENEPWGLAVNEAMCVGLPIVVSPEVGCVADLVVDGENGFTPPARDIEAWTEALRKLIEDAELRARVGEASRQRIRRWSYREVHDGLVRAVAAIDSSQGEARCAGAGSRTIGTVS